MNRETWLQTGWLTALDWAFADFLKDQDTTASDELLLAAALVSRQLGQGEVYLDLQQLSRYPFPCLEQDQALAESDFGRLLGRIAQFELEDWRTTLSASSLVTSGLGDSPLVLDGNRLYLRRYWHYQTSLDAAIALRLQPICNQLPATVHNRLQSLFSANQPQPDWQKIACVLALRARFSIITGGPGTGKTTTLTKLLVLLIEQADKPLQIALAAPTGKAAARVSASICAALQGLDLADSIKQQIPASAQTLHRLLGSRPDTRHYRHNRHNPLLSDIVIVDEASMIDLEMMAALLDALPDSARLILLGDKDQLASVEAGSVMGDLCRGAAEAAYDAASLAWIKHHAGVHLPESPRPGTALNQQTVMLRHSHRFGAQSGIGQLANAVNLGDVAGSRSILSRGATYPDLQHHVLIDPADKQLRQWVLADREPRPGYRHYLHLMQLRPAANPDGYDQWAKSILDAFDTFQVLCAVREGDWGVTGLNRQIERWLFNEQKAALWYPGRPVMITRNDYNLGLNNGDIGMALLDADNQLRVAFPAIDDRHPVRWFSPLRLPEVETAFAMTVHKSQGSEFEHVLMILPENHSPVLSRELIYTGITRAKAYFSLLESRKGIFEQSVSARCSEQ